MEVRKSFRIVRRKSKQPLKLLKDYLLDDLSSCSSAGFMSFPRRPSHSSASSSIRLLLDVDLRTGIPAAIAKTKKKRFSTLLRTVAVKLVNAVKSPLRTTCFLPHSGRSARKLRASEVEEDVGRRRLFGDKEIVERRDVAALVTSYGDEFTVETSSFDGEKGVVSEGKDAVVATGQEKVRGTDGPDCIIGEAVANPIPCSKEWLKNKEQFSPISVLECPFNEDYDDESDPQSECSPANLSTGRGGRRNGGISRLVPVQLELQIASLELEEEKEAARPDREESQEDAEEKDEMETVLERMLRAVKANVPSYDSRKDVLLLDFFREKMEEGLENRCVAFRGRDSFEHVTVRTAQDWACGEEAREAYSVWEVEGGRMAYFKDMERGKVRWDDMGNHEGTDSERYEVCLEVEDVVCTLLVYEVVIDIFG